MCERQVDSTLLLWKTMISSGEEAGMLQVRGPGAELKLAADGVAQGMDGRRLRVRTMGHWQSCGLGQRNLPRSGGGPPRAPIPSVALPPPPAKLEWGWRAQAPPPA